MARRLLATVVALAVVVAGLPLAASGALGASAEIVISEFRVRGPNGAADEFVEIYNRTTAPVDIGGWLLKGSNASGFTSTRATVPAGVVVPPGGHYLFTNSSTSGGPYSGSVPGDRTYTTGITDDGGVAILTASNVIVDQVGMSAGSAYKEGTPLAPLGSSNVNRSYERKPGGVAGSGQDTDDNGTDFAVISPSDPQGAATPAVDTSVCGDAATAIHDVQGSGLTSPLAGSTVSIEGVVVGDYQPSTSFRGFYVQEEDADADADPATSEGVFVFSTSPVDAGDVVRVRGTATEFSGLTEISTVSSVLVCATGASVTPAEVTLPVATYTDFERYEGMLVHFTQTLTATETYTLARFGEVRLAAGGRLYTPTAVTAPGAAALAQQDLNRRRSFVLDDGDNRQNIDPTVHPIGGLSASNTLRSGYTTSDLSGVFDYRFGAYRLQPVAAVPFTPANPRTAAPAAVGGNTRIASMNVLNYFTTIDDGIDICGPGGDLECRGADSAFELGRQRAKILAALAAIDGDIVGLMEIQNDDDTSVADLVAGLNGALGAGTYAYIHTGFIGTDAIKLALIYKPATVTPVGTFAVIDTSVDPRFVDTKNRPSLAQTFLRNGTTEKVTVVVNHLKSKGSACDDLGDPDTGDGQGNCNITRTRAAAALVDWLATDPTGSGSPNVLLIGDMNSYTFEDPISTFTSGGYTNLVRQWSGLDAYSYVFDGQAGYLDHALASAALASHFTGAADWHIDADEPIGLDYNVEFKSAGQITSFYAADAYRASDHDPVIVGLDLGAATPAGLCELTEAVAGGSARSLCAKLDAATAAFARGNDIAARNQINAYVNEVKAQRGKAITPDDADLLVSLAKRL